MHTINEVPLRLWNKNRRMDKTTASHHPNESWKRPSQRFALTNPLYTTNKCMHHPKPLVIFSWKSYAWCWIFTPNIRFLGRCGQSIACWPWHGQKGRAASGDKWSIHNYILYMTVYIIMFTFALQALLVLRSWKCDLRFWMPGMFSRRLFGKSGWGRPTPSHVAKKNWLKSRIFRGVSLEPGLQPKLVLEYFMNISWGARVCTRPLSLWMFKHLGSTTHLPLVQHAGQRRCFLLRWLVMLKVLSC